MVQDMADQGSGLHPHIRFKVVGYRVIEWPDRVSDGRPGHIEGNAHIFPDGSFDDVMAKYPVGSAHDHVPLPPCRYEVLYDGVYDELEHRRQTWCRTCYPPSVAEDNRRSAK